METTKPVPYRRIALATALVLATLTLAYVTYRLNQVVLLFVLSILVAAALRAPVMWLQQRRIARGGAILLLYILIIAVLGVSGFLLSYPLSDELSSASRNFPQRYDLIARQWQDSPQRWQQWVASVVPDLSDLFASIGENAGAIAYGVGGITYNIANLAISLIAILTLTFYWLIDENRFVRLWLTLLPIQQRNVARHTWYDIDRRVGLFVRSEFLQFFLTVALLYLGLDALEVEYPALWGVYAAFVQLIPWVGIPLSLLPALFMFATDPLLVTLSTILLIVVVGTFMDRVVEPWFGVQRIVHPIVSVLALMALGEAAGLVGMLVALPLAATVQSVLSQILQINAGPQAVSQSAYSAQIKTLYDHVAALEQLRGRDPTHQRELNALHERITALLDNTEQVVRDRASAPQRRRMASSATIRSRTSTIFSRNRSR